MPTVLIIDDHASVAQALATLFSLHEIDCLGAASPEQGLALLASEPVDLVIQDMNFRRDTTSGEEGRALFAAIRARHPDLPVVLLTAWTDLEAAVALVKAGAADYLGKPWDDHKLLATMQNLLELGAANRRLQRAARQQQQRQADLRARYDLRGFIFADAATERVLALACQVARADVPVLVTGPSGAGKERIADLIRANSAVRDGPFVTLNCGALPADLVEAELFGAEAGAYTGAQKAREGRFEAADGGTLFLDEIGNLPMGGQMKLLRVLETGRFTRLGANQERQVKVRVLSATNADLMAMMRAGRFREDLYYRLNLIELHLPPLAERSDDIVPLARQFLGDAHRLDDAAAEALQRHDWPGNVRELKNAMQRVALLQPPGVVGWAQLGLPPRRPADAARKDAPPRPPDEPDRQALVDALARAGGVVSQAAAELGLSRQALYRRMDRLGIDRGEGGV
jgi:DNA-binding NtrC family response regulator